jgi:general secretion pathway protein A
MYENYFGFTTLPFTTKPDPRFIYDTPACREAMASLCYGIEGRRGFILITGASGTGKTTLLLDFVQRADMKIRNAFISAGQLSVTGLPRLVLNELDVVPASEERIAVTRQLKKYLIEQLEKNYIVALLVDDAQDLSDELLEELRILSNLETAENKLIQIVLAGQPELEQRLDQPKLRQLRQRIALRCRLLPLKDEEVSGYIQTRLQVAGSDQRTNFAPEAVTKIALYSDRIPRLINMICDSALLYCYGLSKKIVSAEMVDEVARDLQLSGQRSSQKPNATQQDWVKNPRWVIEEPAAVAPVSQRPLAEQIQDVFMSAEPKRKGINWRLSPASLATGFFLAVLAAAGVGGYLYAKANQIYLADMPARILAVPHQGQSRDDGGVKPEASHEASPAELTDDQPAESDRPLASSQPPENSNAGATAAASSDPNKIGSSPVGEALDQPLEKPAVKTDDKNETSKSIARGPGNKPTSDRIEFDIHRAIARHMIRGVEVSVVDGTVFLGGRVDTENQKIAAAKAASNVPGVKYVRDRIVVSHDASS